MLVKTILNHVGKLKSFVYGKVTLEGEGEQAVLMIEIHERSNGKPICSGCGKARPGYDRLPPRRWEHVPLWGLAVLFEYAPRRVECPDCGVVVEAIPWSTGKHWATTSFMWFLARWAKRLSWQEVSEAFKTSWHQVYRSVEMAVQWGIENRNLDGITAIGVDELQWRKGHEYLTLVYQIDEGCSRLLWTGLERSSKTLESFFSWFGELRTSKLRFICSDMYGGYLSVIAEKAKSALNILDRYHIAANLNKAIDKVRAQEVKALMAQGLEPVLKRSRWLFLKRPENMKPEQQAKLRDILRLNLKTVRAYLLKEDLDSFWDYISPHWAGVFLDGWCRKAMRSRIGPIQDMARSFRAHRPLILNWFKARNSPVSLGAVEGFNCKGKLTIRKSYGFRTPKAAQIALYHALGALPEPKFTHTY